MARDKTLDEEIETVLHAAGVPDSGAVAEAVANVVRERMARAAKEAAEWLAWEQAQEENT